MFVEAALGWWYLCQGSVCVCVLFRIPFLYNLVVLIVHSVIQSLNGPFFYLILL